MRKTKTFDVKYFKTEQQARCWATWAKECGKYNFVEVEQEYDNTWYVSYRLKVKNV